jgi:hypothetical protein
LDSQGAQTGNIWAESHPEQIGQGHPEQINRCPPCGLLCGLLRGHPEQIGRGPLRGLLRPTGVANEIGNPGCSGLFRANKTKKRHFMTRNDKIARLPQTIREQINRRLESVFLPNEPKLKKLQVVINKALMNNSMKKTRSKTKPILGFPEMEWVGRLGSRELP